MVEKCPFCAAVCYGKIRMRQHLMKYHGDRIGEFKNEFKQENLALEGKDGINDEKIDFGKSVSDTEKQISLKNEIFPVEAKEGIEISPCETNKNENQSPELKSSDENKVYPYPWAGIPMIYFVKRK